MKKTLAILLILSLAASLFAAPIETDKSNINPIDKAMMAPFHGTTSKVSTVLTGASLLTPAAIVLGGGSDVVTVGVMYAETMALTWVGKELVKDMVYRPRPYLFFDGAPEEKMDDWYDSFPSGHTSLAFASAAFTSSVFGEYYPESKWKTPVTVGSFALAGTVGALRVASGSHYLTDVLTGAAWGTICGLLIPKLHTLGSKTTVGLTPYGLLFDISL